MKVLVAVGAVKRPRNGDFNYCVPGELVRFPGMTCDCPDCGCERAMAGMASSKATTMFGVEDRPSLTRDEYRAAFVEALRREGWLSSSGIDLEVDLTTWADEHLAVAARFEDGDVLGLVNGEVVRRR
jgi:hypothetical protein